MKRIILSIISGILLVVFLLGFVDIVQDEPVESKEVFTYSISSIPRDLKSIGNLATREQDVICAVSRGLVELDSEGNILPSLAESVEVRDDGLEYDFKIRKDIFWSDGSSITPKDISTFFREILTEENSENIGALLNVYGAKAFRDGVGSFTENVGISTTEDNLVIRLNSKNDEFINELSKPQYRLRKNVLLWEDISNNYNNIVYSGDYNISSMDINEIVLKRNNNINPKLVETIHIVQDEGEELAMAAFEVGSRDIVINPPKSQLTRLKEENKLITVESNKAMYIAFNPNSESLPLEGKKEIYKLLNDATEEYQLQNSMFLELSEGSYFREDKSDLAKLQTRKVMSNTSEEWGKIDELVIIAEEKSENKAFCEFLSTWFKDNTNIVLSYNLLPKSEMTNVQSESYYHLALFQCNDSMEGEESFYNMIIRFLAKENREKFINANTESERKSLFTSMEDTLFNTYQVLPLAFYNDNIAIDKKIKNIKLDGNGNIDFNKLEK